MESLIVGDPRKKPARKKEAIIRARVDSDVKEKAEKILEQIGLSPSEAIRLFLQQVTLRRGLPFEVRIPNAETVKPLETAESGDGAAFLNGKAFRRATD